MLDWNLKHKWDNKAVLDYAISEAAKEAAKKATKETELKKGFSFVRSLIEGTDFSDEKIANLASVSPEFVQKARAESQGN